MCGVAEPKGSQIHLLWHCPRLLRPKSFKTRKDSLVTHAVVSIMCRTNPFSSIFFQPECDERWCQLALLINQLLYSAKQDQSQLWACACSRVEHAACISVAVSCVVFHQRHLHVRVVASWSIGGCFMAFVRLQNKQTGFLVQSLLSVLFCAGTLVDCLDVVANGWLQLKSA